MAVSKRLRHEILKRDNYTCRYCRSVDNPLTIDHVIPVALGGTDEPTNLVAACKDCNAGKSSVPADAALVADVSNDALRWAAAMQQVAAEYAVEREAAEKLYGKFKRRWDNFKNWRGEPLPLPANWRASIDQFLVAGLLIEDVVELIGVAMESPANDTWRYLCGCCWTRIRKMQERAAEIVGGDLEPPQAVLTTCWIEKDLAAHEDRAERVAARYLSQESFESAFCRHRDWGGGTCGDPVCRMQRAEVLGWMADSEILKSYRDDEVMDEAEVLLDG